MRLRHFAPALCAATALTLSACSVSNAPAQTETVPAPTPVTISVLTYGELDYSTLVAQYKVAHPEVTVEATHLETLDEARAAVFDALAAGEPIPDVIAVDEAWWGDLAAHPGALVDLGDYGIGDRAVDWREGNLAQATDASGNVLGYPVEVRPLAVCYNTKRFEAAGLPIEPDKVARLLGSDWERFMEIGTMYREATGKAWFDSTATVWNAMVAQVPGGYYQDNGTVDLANNAALKARWSLLSSAVAGGQSAKLTPGDWGAGAALVDGSTAVVLCQLGQIDSFEAQVTAGGGDATTGWAIADVMPGGAASAGGTYLAVSGSSPHPDRAAELASWLTMPDQQAALYKTSGLYPAAVAAQQQLAAGAAPNAFFGDASVPTLLLSRALDVNAHTVGVLDTTITTGAFAPAVAALDSGTKGEDAWNTVVTAVATAAQEAGLAPVPSQSPSATPTP